MKKYLLKNYLEYLKDNPNGYWFKRKLYGWGWTPATWQGWLTTLLFIVIILANGFYLATFPQPTKRQLQFFFGILVISIITLITICYKTGEKPRWMWGQPK